LRQVFLWALPFVSANDAFYNVFLSLDTRFLHFLVDIIIPSDDNEERKTKHPLSSSD
jgi:hypothetical protein